MERLLRIRAASGPPATGLSKEEEMARYDAPWGGGRYRFYDSPYRGFGTGPGEGAGYGRPLRTGYGQGYAPGTEIEREVDTRTAVYGPGRYGLGPYHERLRQRRRSDAELREEVEEALFYDTWVDAEAIEVEVKDGIVTLSGALPSYEEVRYATDDAWDVDGVLGVRSQLTVRQR